ncbi:ecto-NOX disulfide-thiol exchanger 1 like protein [Danaus plexippus plexippus]|uniref:Ecto-NOX disulfide-thiol exchanger 1 like protein n=1 Tax=Danaus plexippus plexippus TaxID=278856 RepID=A0A212EPP7_DANPL|nr:ecto-NOX disulfide-thiol exchanger 2-like isoform X1 [Danaus plexippus plexippus]OWR43446.1 ecto-NOX disulfide-thiol exchanger 1 like protein [Danaus plexippus plexippus]
MNTWAQENYQMGMSPIMPPSILPPPMMMQEMNVPPLNPPPIPLLTSITTEDMNIVTDDMSDTNITCHDVSGNETRNHRSRSRDRSLRRDKDHQDRRHRSRSRDCHDRYNRNDKRNVERNDRTRNVERERKTKWDNNRVPKNNVQQIHAGINMGMNMGMIPGMNMISFQNMLPNMIGQQPLDGTLMPQHIMPNIMMANMMPNMLDQNIMMMNQQNMMPLPNQQIYLNNGVMLPPIPGTVTPERRERPKGCRTIFVGGLPLNVTNDTLMEMFQKFGSIEDIKSPKSGVYYIRFERPESVAPSFFLTGYRFKFHDQIENEATTIFVDYALNRDDQNEYERRQRHREKTPPRVEPFSQTALTNLSEKIKSETEFATAAPTLAVWLERGECSKRHANAFYSLIQASNNQIRRLFTEKMQLDDDFQNMKNAIKEKFAHVVMQCE